MPTVSGLTARARRAARAFVRPPEPAGPRPQPEQRYVVVVTYGRSGSTLVQGLLNTLPRTLVRGEGNLYVLSFFRAWQHIRVFRDLHMAHAPRQPHSAFYGLQNLKPRSVVLSTRALVREHLLGDVDPDEVDVLGFKEVAWHRARPGEVAALFEFLDKVLPGCLYVLNGRDHEQLFGSGFWKGHDPQGVAAKVARVEAMQQHLRETRPDRVVDLRYELTTSSDPAVRDAELRRIAEFVHGSCPPDLLERMRETLAVGHGPYPFGASREDRS